MKTTLKAQRSAIFSRSAIFFAISHFIASAIFSRELIFMSEIRVLIEVSRDSRKLSQIASHKPVRFIWRVNFEENGARGEEAQICRILSAKLERIV